MSNISNANDIQKEIWTDNLGNTLWTYYNRFLITTVFTRTEISEREARRLYIALDSIFGADYYAKD